MPPTVHTVQDVDGRLVLLDVATGRWYLLNRAGAIIYQVLRTDADIDRAVDALIDRYDGVPADRIRADVDALVSALVRRGLVELRDDRARGPAGVLTALPADDTRVPVRWRIAAAAAFPIALVLLRLPFRTTTRLVTRYKAAKSAATDAEALAALGGAHWVGRHYPGRVACLEVSLTAVLAAALLGTRLDWCFGFAVDPYSFHAWIEVTGRPVNHPTDEPIPPTYRRVFRI